MNSGIYVIHNIVNDKVYVGSTIDFIRRKKDHFRKLVKGKHNLKLQRAYNKYGRENFVFEIKEECPYTKEIILFKEQEWMDRLDSQENGYNILGATFGDILTHHPDAEGIKKRISKGLLAYYSLLSPEERRILHSQPGEANGMFDRTHDQAARLAIGNSQRKYKEEHGHGRTKGWKMGNDQKKFLSDLAKTRIGEKNAFYKKRHTQDAKKRIGDKRRGKSPTNAKQISVDGILYEHRRAASELLDIKQETLWYRANSKNFPNTFWVEEMV